jgi:hypothetical protein
MVRVGSLEAATSVCAHRLVCYLVTLLYKCHFYNMFRLHMTIIRWIHNVLCNVVHRIVKQLHVATYPVFAWLVIMGFGFDDRIYWPWLEQFTSHCLIGHWHLLVVSVRLSKRIKSFNVILHCIVVTGSQGTSPFSNAGVSINPHSARLSSLTERTVSHHSRPTAEQEPFMQNMRGQTLNKSSSSF